MSQVNRQKMIALERAAAHWAAVAKLLVWKLAEPGATVHLTKADFASISVAKGPQAVDILCQPDGDDGLNIRLCTIEESTRLVAQETALRNGKAGGRN